MLLYPGDKRPTNLPIEATASNYAAIQAANNLVAQAANNIPLQGANNLAVQPANYPTIQEANKLMLPPKCEIIMMLSNYLFFQYCGITAVLFSIAPCKVIALNLLCFIYGISSLLLFSKVIALPTIATSLLFIFWGHQ